MEPPDDAQTVHPPRRAGRRPDFGWSRCCFASGGASSGIALVAVVILRAFEVFVAGNFSAVAPQQCYRSAQPPMALLPFLTHYTGTRTIVNLRGVTPGAEWSRAEQAAADEQGVALVNIRWSSVIPPTREQMLELLDTFDRLPAPYLLHCYSGADRTGLAAAVYVLLRTDGTLQEARFQLHPFFGHIPWGRSWQLDCVLQQYERWLARDYRRHTAANFRYWILGFYDGELDDEDL